MTVTKDHIVNSICRQLDIPKKKSADLLESLLEMIQKNLQSRGRCFDQRLRKVLCQEQECTQREKSRDRGRSDARLKKGRYLQVFPDFASES